MSRRTVLYMLASSATTMLLIFLVIVVVVHYDLREVANKAYWPMLIISCLSLAVALFCAFSCLFSGLSLLLRAAVGRERFLRELDGNPLSMMIWKELKEDRDNPSAV